MGKGENMVTVVKPASKYYICEKDISERVLEAACIKELDPEKYIAAAKKTEEYKYTGLFLLYQTGCQEDYYFLKRRVIEAMKKDQVCQQK